ncbi:MAG: hypothetical protein ACLFVJ_16265 [Persicimonas sp.]
MSFEVGKRHVFSAIALGVVVGVLQVQCESNDSHEEAESQAAYKLTPDEQLAHLEVSSTVQGAQQEALRSAFRQVNRQLQQQSRAEEAKAPSADETDVLTFLFSANIHGEREDCGCKSNPLGGLTRRQTLIELAADPSADEAKKWWGDDLPAPDVSFEVDAGDLLFKNSSLGRHPERLQDKAEQEARALVDALAVNPPDVLNVGEIDLALGLDTYKEIVSEKKLPVISANLYDSDGKQAFEGHRVVERDGKKVALIGLLKDNPRVEDYYETRDVQVKSAADAYRSEAEKLGEDVDLVVMLSNLGTSRTAELIEQIRGEDHKRSGARIDAAIVSNTNRLTRKPQWAAGVPIVEPLSRGKYFGRLDLMLGDQPGVSFANAVADPREIVQNYRRAWGSYFNARDQRRDAAREIAELQKQLADHSERAKQSDDKAKKAEKADKPQKTDQTEKGKAGKFVEANAEQTRSRIESLEKKLETLEKRVEVTSKTLAGQSSRLSSIDDLASSADGDDWASVRIVQLKLDIPQQQQVRKVLDSWKDRE